MGIFPDFGGLSGIDQLKVVIGALLTLVLVVAVLMTIVCGVVWGLAASVGNAVVASKARVGALTGCGAAALAGAGVAWMNWLIDLGVRVVG